MIRPDTSFANVETKINSIADQLANLTLIEMKTKVDHLKPIITRMEIWVVRSVRGRGMDRISSLRIRKGIPNALP